MYNASLASLYCLILTMVMCFMINQTINVFVKKIETIQYNAALAITGAIKGISQMKLYSELGLRLDGGLENYICFLRLKKLAYQNIYLT